MSRQSPLDADTKDITVKAGQTYQVGALLLTCPPGVPALTFRVKGLNGRYPWQEWLTPDYCKLLTRPRKSA